MKSWLFSFFTTDLPQIIDLTKQQTSEAILTFVFALQNTENTIYL